jgi:eukaryotic-like serine/threonine-protein kinase
MSQQAMSTPLPTGASTAVPGSLRAEMDARRAAGRRFSVKESLGIIVPVCTRLAALHAQGTRLFAHPSSLALFPDGRADVLEAQAHLAPTLPRDRACLAPEERKGAEGDARASVFAVGAILYELLTNASVGPGMRRPVEMVPDLPPALESILGKALVADAKHRPGDLLALAQALHHVAPSASIAPPAADESHLDHDDDFEVDVRLSMIPPNEAPPSTAIPRAAAVPKIQVSGEGPYAVVAAQPAPSPMSPADPTRRLADMKAALESDPRPRYVVIKEGMDHGPFSAVELLQQIASGQFTEENVLRDTFTSDERFIKDWEEFAPFAEQAKLNREIVKEKRQLDAVVTAERKGTQYKALIGAAVIGVFAAGALGLWARDRQNKERAREVQGQSAVSVETDGGIGPGTKKPGVGGPIQGGGVGPGGRPMLPGGMSCEGARARYIEDFDKAAPPDLSAGAYGAVLNKGTYLNACGVPSSMSVTICAAVQNGRAVGVTVTTKPSNKGISSCVAGAVRSLSFPSHPRLDVTTTSFAAN